MNPIRAIRARVRGYWRAILAEHTSPEKLAAATLVGVIVGFTPLYGFHFFLCVGIAFLLRLNKITVYAAAHVSMPPLVPVIGFLSVQTGEMILHGHFLSLHYAEFRHDPELLIGRFFLDWLLGGLAVGGVFGVAFAAVVYRVARARARALGNPVVGAIRAASKRYKGAPRKLRFYAWFKYRLDPCYRAIAARVPDGAFVVDLGTGLGMLPLVLALLPGGRRALGVDWDEPKLAAGRTAAAGLDGIELVTGDARTFEIPPCDAVTLVDVLHYYPPDEQRALLARCAAALKEGGRLLVRDGDRARKAGGWTRTVEDAATKSGWNKGGGGNAWRSAEEIARDLEALGLEVEIAPVAGRLHPGNVLLSAVRAPSPSPPTV